MDSSYANLLGGKQEESIWKKITILLVLPVSIILLIELIFISVQSFYFLPMLQDLAKESSFHQTLISNSLQIQNSQLFIQMENQNVFTQTNSLLQLLEKVKNGYVKENILSQTQRRVTLNEILNDISLYDTIPDERYPIWVIEQPETKEIVQKIRKIEKLISCLGRSLGKTIERYGVQFFSQDLYQSNVVYYTKPTRSELQYLIQNQDKILNQDYDCEMKNFTMANDICVIGPEFKQLGERVKNSTFLDMDNKYTYITPRADFNFDNKLTAQLVMGDYDAKEPMAVFSRFQYRGLNSKREPKYCDISFKDYYQYFFVYKGSMDEQIHREITSCYLIGTNQGRLIDFQMNSTNTEIIEKLKTAIILDRNNSKIEALISDRKYIYDQKILNLIAQISINTKVQKFNGNQQIARNKFMGLMIEINPHDVFCYVLDTFNQINILKIVFLVTSVILFIISTYISLRYGVWMGLRVQEPVESLTNLLRGFNENGEEVDQEIGPEQEIIFRSCFEINVLYEAMSRMLNHLKFSNQQARYSDQGNSIIELSKAKQFFKESQNLSGLGICANNIGNIHLKKQRYLEAIAEYQQSILAAQMEFKEIQNRLKVLNEFKREHFVTIFDPQIQNQLSINEKMNNNLQLEDQKSGDIVSLVNSSQTLVPMHTRMKRVTSISSLVNLKKRVTSHIQPNETSYGMKNTMIPRHMRSSGTKIQDREDGRRNKIKQNFSLIFKTKIKVSKRAQFQTNTFTFQSRNRKIPSLRGLLKQTRTIITKMRNYTRTPVLSETILTLFQQKESEVNHQ